MVHKWGTKLTKLDFYAPNARYHLKGQKKEKKSISYASCTKNWYTVEGQNWKDYTFMHLSSVHPISSIKHRSGAYIILTKLFVAAT